MCRLNLVAALAAALWSVVGAAGAGSPGQILDAYRAASGGDAWKAKAALESDADLAAYGLTGTQHSLLDLVRGRMVESYRLGPSSGGDGYDGTASWDRDENGTVTLREGGEAGELTANRVYRDTNAWWRPDRGGAKIVAAVGRKDGKEYDALTVTPAGGKPFDARFDRASHLLVEIVEKRGARTIVTRFSDYADFAGVKLPRRTVVDDGTGEKYRQTATLTRAAFVALPPDAAFAPPKSEANDAVIAGGAAETSLPFKLVNNHIYGTVRIDGQGPFTAIFDTGGINLVTPALARKLGIKAEGKLPTTGSGEGVMEAGFAHVERIGVGAATVKNQTVVVMPLDKMENVEGVPMPAMVGYETFRRFVTRIDYGAGKITLIDPEHFDAKDAGTAVPFTFNDRLPEVAGTFEGIPAKFDIDTGARNDVTLNKPFVVRNGLVAGHPKGIRGVDGWGVGGPATGYDTRGREMTLGPVKIDNFVAAMADQDKGAFSGDDFQGNVGGGILKRFVVTFDYGHKVMYLKPLAHPKGEVGTYDRAGVWINRTPEGFVVAAVTKSAPAEAAGLIVGDAITAVDGKKAAAIALPDLRARLRTDPAGTVVTFAILRAGQLRTVRVTLRDLI